MGGVEIQPSEPLLIVPKVAMIVIKNNELKGCEEMGNPFYGRMKQFSCYGKPFC